MRRRSWTQAEHEALAAFYPAISAQRLTKILPNRTPKAIRQEAFDLGLRKCSERVAEAMRENVLKRHYPDSPSVFQKPAPPIQ